MESNLTNTVLFSCENRTKTTTEQLIAEHTLVAVISGSLELQFTTQKIILETNDITIIRRNELVKTKKIPTENGLPFKSVSIFLGQELLRTYALKNKIQVQEKYIGQPMLDLTNNKFIKAFFDSLLPYINQSNKFSIKMAALKCEEAVELLLGNNLVQFLFDLSEPHKIDLEKFINENFIFNIPLPEFARLTGRSLSTFKRDFQKIYNTAPEKWLKNRRLDEANYLINEKKQKPSEVYYNIGFENFSHFSTAYKQKFGHNASAK